MSVEPPDPAILDAIRANRDAFDRATIDRELLASGYSPAAIAAAWAALVAEAAALPPAATDPATTEPFLPEPVVEPEAGRDPAIARYIREQRGLYTRPAITDSLLASGHSRADIEAVWAELAAAEAPPPASPGARAGRRAVLNSWRFWLTASLTLIALIVAPIVLTIAFPDRPIGAGASCVLMIGFVAAGLILLGLGKARDVAYGFLWGVGALFALASILALLGFILLIIVFGICLVALGTSGFNP